MDSILAEHAVARRKDAIMSWDNGLGRVFACKASASNIAATVEDESVYLVCEN